MNPEYKRVILDNGITVVGEMHPHLRSVCVGVWVKVGSRHETANANGMSHFIEHMVFKGTKSRAPLEIATAIESLGGDLNAFTDREYTCYHATVLSEHLSVALDVLGELVTVPRFPRDEMERERKVLLQELSMVQETPDDWIHDLFFETTWKNHPLGQGIIGSKKTLLSTTRRHLVSFFEDHYRPESMVISVAGNFDFEKLRSQCEKIFQFTDCQQRLLISTKKPQFSAASRHITVDTEQLHVMMGYPGTSYQDPDRFDSLVLGFFLGGGMSSRLFQEIREKAGLAYSVDAECVSFSDAGLMTIYMGMSPNSYQQAMGIIEREIGDLVSKPLPEESIKLVKGQLKGTVLLMADQMEVRQESLGRNEMVFGRHVPVSEVIEAIDKVNSESLFKMAKKIFGVKRHAMVTLGPKKPISKPKRKVKSGRKRKG